MTARSSATRTRSPSRFVLRRLGLINYAPVPKKARLAQRHITINQNINERCREAFVAVALISAACCQATASNHVLIVC